MGRHTFLDTILKRPSQNYAPPPAESDGRQAGGSYGRQTRYAGPTDLPNAPGSAPPNSLLSGSLFGRGKRRSSVSTTGGYGAGSVAGSDAGGPSGSLVSFGRTRRFGKSKRDSSMAPANYYPEELRPDYNGPNAMRPAGGAAAPPSVADSSKSKSKKSWWRRASRTQSISGDSIFSEPGVPPSLEHPPPWTAQGSLQQQQRSPQRRAHSEIGGPSSPRYRTFAAAGAPPVPPVPQHLRDSTHGAASPTGRLHSNVAPLGSASLNPTLSTKPPKPRAGTEPRSAMVRKTSMTSQGSGPELRHAASQEFRAASPAVSQSSMVRGRRSLDNARPPERALSPVQRFPSPSVSDAGMSRLRSGASSRQSHVQPSASSSDWKNFVQSFSGSDISKVWEGGRVGAPDLQTAARTRTLSASTQSNKIDRRRTQVDRLRKELEADAQYDQIQRDAGVVHQDLLARAASVVVGRLSTEGLRPGSILPGHASSTGPSEIVRPVASRVEPPMQRAMSPRVVSPSSSRRNSNELGQRDAFVQRRSFEMTAANQDARPSHVDVLEDVKQEGSEESSETESSDEADEAEQTFSPGRRPVPMLEAVREEDEESSQAHSRSSKSSRRTSRALTLNDQNVLAEPLKDAEIPESNSESAADGRPSVETLARAEEPSDRRTEPAKEAIAETDDEPTPMAAPVSLPPAPTKAAAPAESAMHTIVAASDVPAAVEDRASEVSSSSSDGSTTEKHEGIDEVSSSEEEADTTTRPRRSKYQLNASRSTLSLRTDLTHRTDRTDRTETNESVHTAEEGDAETDRPRPVVLPPGKSLDTIASDSSLATAVSGTSGSYEEAADDAVSQRSGQTGRATVTFRKGSKDAAPGSSPAIYSRPLSRSASFSSSTRPTLSKRISDVSLGTSFGMSNMLRTTSRASTRRQRGTGSDGGSDGDRSGDDDDDEELKARIKAEQDRLRSIKVGEDFFGGSIASILDRFDRTDWKVSEPSNTVGALGLEIGTSSTTSTAHKHHESSSPAVILARNAQERISEVRRIRAEGSGALPRGRADSLDQSDSKTVDSLATPSLAALWMLNEDSDYLRAGSYQTDQAEESQVPRMTASQSATSASTVSASSDGMPRSSSLWSVPPRRGSLAPAHSESAAAQTSSSILNRPRPRKPRPNEMGGVKIASGHLEADVPTQEAPVEDVRSTLDNIWRGPEERKEDVASFVQSKDKPAPSKSAIKGGNTPKTLADTLFSISPFSSEKRKDKKARARKADAESIKSEKSEVATHKRGGSHDTTSSRKEAALDADQRSLASTATRSTLASDWQPTDSAESAMDSKDAVATAGDEAGRSAAEFSRPEHGGETPAARRDDAQTELIESQGHRSLTSPPGASEGWSGASTASTGGPTTPSPSEMLGQQNPLSSLAQVEDAPELPPKSIKRPGPKSEATFAETLRASDSEVVRHEVHDNDMTPLAERQEPSFGMNLIPPTPPAISEAQQAPPPLQRTLSSRSRASATSDETSKGSRTAQSDMRTPDLRQFPEYKGRDLSLPAGLVAVSVASSTARQRITEPVPEEEEESTIAQVAGGKEKGVARSKSSGKKKKTSSRANEEGSKSNEKQAPSPPASSAASSAFATAVQNRRESSLRPQAVIDAANDASSSLGSEPSSGMPSRSVSPAVTPAANSSGQSSAVSSSAHSDSSSRGRGPVSSTVVPPPIPRKVRTVTPGNNGHARTSLMSAINEWESSPLDDAPSRSQSPSISPRVRTLSSPKVAGSNLRPESSVARSDTSVRSGTSPSIVRKAPMGAPAAAFLDGASQAHALSPSSTSSYALSASGRESPAPWRDSVMSFGGQSEYSATSMPSVPAGSYKAKDPVKASNAIDDRLYAKTTMLTVSVTSGAFKNKSLRHRKSTSAVGEDTRYQLTDSPADTALMEELRRTVISVTSHTAPPRKMSSTQVLVQVIACALDEMDRLILRERVRGETAYGFVPGRSFCGRVMETGWEVKRLRKGDVIFGLQNSKKCGALAEFLTIEQDLVAKAPEDCLTTEQIAALPSVGILTHQLMTNYCSQVPRGSRILILNAHDGVGLLTMQNCASLGLIIVAHCPQHISDGVAICEANGAHEVIVGEPLWALNTLHESSFDLVIDTIGGRRLYDAARRIIAFEGQFCTCFGDLQHSSTANPNLRSHLRSLRRSFFKKDTKRIGYEWVGTDTVEDNREALESVRQAAEEGAICPRLRSVLGMSEAPRAFETTLRPTSAEGDEPGAVVVRIG